MDITREHIFRHTAAMLLGLMWPCLALHAAATHRPPRCNPSAELDSPCWRGRAGNGVTVAPPGTRILDPKDMKLLWKSEADVPWGWNHPNGVPGYGISGGYASPIVVGDCVYQYFYRPAGPDHHGASEEGAGQG